MPTVVVFQALVLARSETCLDSRAVDMEPILLRSLHELPGLLDVDIVPPLGMRGDKLRKVAASLVRR